MVDVFTPAERSELFAAVGETGCGITGKYGYSM